MDNITYYLGDETCQILNVVFIIILHFENKV